MKLTELLKQYFGYDTFRPGQRQIIEYVLAGRDGLVIMPTGGGKSLCFQLPALMLDGLTLVVSPLISLMKDQVDGLNAAGIPAAVINSTVSPAQIAATQRDILAGKIKLVYVAPERFAVSSFDDFLHEVKLSLIAVDEAHCISEWGHDFRPEYRNLRTLRQRFSNVPVLALTATATEQVRRDIGQQLGLSGGRVFISSFDRPNLSYSVWPKKKSFPKMMGLLKAYENESAIVYCSSRRNTEKLAEQFRARGIKARAYHAGLEAEERREVQEQFIHDRIQVVTATVAFGMGIDKSNVRLVMHYDLPRNVEGYYQETGRAGRDGLPSRCVLFFSYGDRQKHAFLIGQLTDQREKMKAFTKLDEVVRFCSEDSCRRRFLLNYFGEAYSADGCGNCDICEPDLGVEQAVSVQIKGQSAAIGNGDPVLFEKLRRARKDLAAERQVPAYVVFSDRTLHELAAAMPQTLGEMGTIFGVGDKKLKDFGEAFLKVLREHEPTADESLQEPKSSTLALTQALLAERLSIEEVAARRGLSAVTIMGHIEKLIAAGEPPDLSHIEFDQARLEKIRLAFAEKGNGKLAPVRELLGDDYSWDELRLARLLIYGGGQ